jgi:hypothetical protein
VTGVTAALLAFALMARRPSIEHGETSVAPTHARLEAPASSSAVVESAARPPVVLELGVTREGGQHQTLLRIRPEPQGDFRVEETDAVAVPEPK